MQDAAQRYSPDARKTRPDSRAGRRRPGNRAEAAAQSSPGAVPDIEDLGRRTEACPAATVPDETAPAVPGCTGACIAACSAVCLEALNNVVLNNAVPAQALAHSRGAGPVPRRQADREPGPPQPSLRGASVAHWMPLSQVSLPAPGRKVRFASLRPSLRHCYRRWTPTDPVSGHCCPVTASHAPRQLARAAGQADSSQ